MLLTIYLLLILCGVFIKESKVYNFLTVSFLGFITLDNYSAADYASLYLPTYLNPSFDSKVGAGWIYLCYLGNFIHLSYNSFAAIVCMLCVGCLILVSSKLHINSSFVLCIFLIYPGLISIVQFRQFVASILTLVAVCVLCSNKKGKIIYYYILILVASSIHSSAIIMFLIPILFYYNKLKKVSKIIFGFFLIFAVVYVFSNYEKIALMFFGEKTNIYLSDGAMNHSLFGQFKNVFLLVLMAVWAFTCERNLSFNRYVDGKNSEYSARVFKCFLYANYLMLIFLPVISITDDFMRFERYAFTCDIFIFSFFACSFRKGHGSRVIYAVLASVFALFYVMNNYEGVYIPLLTYSPLNF